jgi:nicotinamidase-related amidase
MQKVHLVIIDPQDDFCFPGSPSYGDPQSPDFVPGKPQGALFVDRADEDMKRLTKFIKRTQEKLQAIHCTLDSHHLVDIAHPIFWVDRDGKHPNPFTIITADEVEAGEWRTSKVGRNKRGLDYVRALRKNDRYPLCIWPPHCLIGSKGAAVVPELQDEMNCWAERHNRTIGYVTKGSNPWTEHYSAVIADVPDPEDPTTQLNAGFIHTLEEADIILLAGEAGSHCLANTVRDIANNFADESYVKKFFLLEDATSPVQGFENLQKDFIKEMEARGMKKTTTETWMS